MAKLEYLILHCSATPNDMEVTEEHLRQWHLVERGWRKLGYSKLFQRSGNVIDLYDIDNDQWIDGDELTNGARGFNSKSVHWCFAGGNNHIGSPDGVVNDKMFIAFRQEINDFLKYHPQVKIIGHNQVADKMCPCFYASELLKLIGVPKKYILEGKIT